MCWWKKNPMRATGIDISKWDSSFNPPANKPQFVIQRAAYGLSKDALFDALNIGVQRVPIRGAYQYLLSSINWKAQAEAFMQITEPKGFHFYVCDFEGTYNNLSVDFASAAVEWMRYVNAWTNKPVMIYSNVSTYNDYLSKDPRTASFPFWLARINAGGIPDPQTSSPDLLPTARKDWTIWQYSFGEHNSFGAENGVGRTGCDVNVYNGTLEQMRAWLSLDAAVPDPEPTDEEKLDILWREAKLHGWNMEN